MLPSLCRVFLTLRPLPGHLSGPLSSISPPAQNKLNSVGEGGQHEGHLNVAMSRVYNEDNNTRMRNLKAERWSRRINRYTIWAVIKAAMCLRRLRAMLINTQGRFSVLQGKPMSAKGSHGERLHCMANSIDHKTLCCLTATQRRQNFPMYMWISVMY